MRGTWFLSLVSLRHEARNGGQAIGAWPVALRGQLLIRGCAIQLCATMFEVQRDLLLIRADLLRFSGIEKRGQVDDIDMSFLQFRSPSRLARRKPVRFRLNADGAPVFRFSLSQPLLAWVVVHPLGQGELPACRLCGGLDFCL